MGEEGKLTGTELKHDGHNGKGSDNGMNSKTVLTSCAQKQ